MKYIIKKIKIGMVLNPLPYRINRPKARYRELTLMYPSRLNAMALDPSKIEVNQSGIYAPGEIVFSLQIFKKVNIRTRKDKRLCIHTTSARPQLILHAVRLMQTALGITHGFDISVQIDREMRHCGFGSSSGLIAAVAVSINELHGNPVSTHNLIKYLAQNHGEEIDGDQKYLQHVQCIGGSAAAGLIRGGMVVLAGAGTPIAAMSIPNDRHVVIGVPRDFRAPDAKTLMKLEMKNMQKFINTGTKFGPTVAYQILHTTLPAMVERNLKKASQVIFDYRFKYGSIKNCSFVYPPMVKLAGNIRYLFNRPEVETLALSSVGPAFFAITKHSTSCRQIFKKMGMRVFLTKINNDGYRIIKKVKNGK